MDHGIMRNPTSAKIDFAIHPSQMPGFPIPDIQIQTQKSSGKETSMNKYHFLVQGTQTTLKMGFLNPLKLDEHPSLDHKVSFVAPPNVPRLSQGPPGRQS